MWRVQIIHINGVATLPNALVSKSPRMALYVNAIEKKNKSFASGTFPFESGSRGGEC